ncbi:MAG: hypothetical protein OXF61_07790 [Acidimicrobiaceae bacterium]|nr:hypothetical protein [Acidimicrobiaceae bacterium]
MLGSVALLVVGLTMLASLTSLSYASLVGIVWTGIASRLGALPVPLLAAAVIAVTLGLWRRYR